jgi:hypothetical protein
VNCVTAAVIGLAVIWGAEPELQATDDSAPDPGHASPPAE